MLKKEFVNWGLIPKVLAGYYQPKDYDTVASKLGKETSIIARGNGRCYGDSSLNKKIFSTLSLNKILFIDEQKDIIKCESGVLLSEILELLLTFALLKLLIGRPSLGKHKSLCLVVWCW